MSATGGAPGMPEPTVRLSIPEEGLRDGDLLLRPPREADIDGLLPALAGPEIRKAGNLPALGRAEALATFAHLPALAASGRMLPLVATDAGGGEPFGGATLHHLDAERAIVEIGYWLVPRARGRGLATRIARLLAEHAFALGVLRVEAYVNVGNDASDRVLEGAGYRPRLRGIGKALGITKSSAQDAVKRAKRHLGWR